MLTDEKISELWMSLEPGAAGNANVFARAIEAAVREEMAKQEPVVWVCTINNSRIILSAERPPKDVCDEGTLQPLYAAPVVPDGMVMMPREPTVEMINAAQNEHMGIPKLGLKVLYSAMITAAEKQNAR